jgi:hypothetical protein
LVYLQRILPRDGPCDSTQEELKESIELDELIRERGAEANPREKIANKLQNVLVNVGV